MAGSPGPLGVLGTGTIPFLMPSLPKETHFTTVTVLTVTVCQVWHMGGRQERSGSRKGGEMEPGNTLYL